MAEQLIFDLPERAALGRGDFFVSSANVLAVTRLDDTETWSNAKLALTGPEGAGKSHLAHAWSKANHGHVMLTADLPSADIPGIATPLAVEIPDAPMPSAEEESLFHLHNHMIAQNLPLLLIARTPPARWTITLPDLKSRMQATDVVQIEAPDEALLSAMLVKLFTDRQLQIDPNLIPWLVTHSERSFAAINRLVVALDAEALAQKRAITRPLARRVLDKLDEERR
jgi:chromosomal replication initiation ATPase DnaA